MERVRKSTEIRTEFHRRLNVVCFPHTLAFTQITPDTTVSSEWKSTLAAREQRLLYAKHSFQFIQLDL